MDPDRLAEHIAENKERQRALYGATLAERVHGVMHALGVTQGVIAAAVGMSPAMLSQLVSARRVKIGDPAVLTRLLLLVERSAAPVPDVPALLAEVRAADPRLQPAVPAAPAPPAQPPVPPPAPPEPAPVPARPAAPGPGVRARRAAAPRPDPASDALRGVAGPARLVAAAAALSPAFPEIAALLRRAASSR